MSNIDPVPLSAYPSLAPVVALQPNMPSSWSGVALLHPFSPPLAADPTPDSPFFQLCVANLAYVVGSYFSAQIAGCDDGNWWYVVNPEGTFLSSDMGNTWSATNMGWSLPQDWFGGQIAAATCVGASPLNWMPGPTVTWWKLPVNPVAGAVSAATWMWFDASSQAPVRMMFGAGPPTPTMGDPTQLALFQMYSMSYMPVFFEQAPAQPPAAWSTPTFPGYLAGNPNNYENFAFNGNFGTTTFMTPVNEAFNPLPTRMLYVWKPDAEYVVTSDRSQSTSMGFDYNLSNDQPLATQVALLTGPAPASVQPAPFGSGQGFLINYYETADLAPTCVTGSNFPFAQEPPNWVSAKTVNARICATIVDNPVLAPDNTVTVFGVLFPPSAPNYPEATYLWTWYAPLDASGSQSRPVTFMQSQSALGVGTSLALADYFYFEAYAQPIDPANFAIPTACMLPAIHLPLGERLAEEAAAD
jgi:hypothetical protein